MISGRSINIFVIGQSANSLKKVDLYNWIGLSFVGLREQVKMAREREELTKPCIYFLLSDSSDESLTNIYIGETDNFTERVVDHVRKKDWWSKFIVFVSKDGTLTKAHVRYLERELLILARASVSKLTVRNDQEPGGSSLPEADRSSMREFLDNMLFVMETLGYNFFSKERPVIQSSTLDRQPDNSLEGEEFNITLPKDLNPGSEQLKSSMIVRNGEYVLKAGSFIRAEANESLLNHDSYHALWKQIISSDAIKNHSLDTVKVTTKDLPFRSPSAAGAVVRARTTNGRVEWRRISDGITLAQCEVDSDE